MFSTRADLRRRDDYEETGNLGLNLLGGAAFHSLASILRKGFQEGRYGVHILL